MGDKDSQGPESATSKNVPENSELTGLEENMVDSSFDISGKSLDFPLLDGAEGGGVEGELSNLVELERLQVKLSLPGMNGLDLQKLKNLKELELCKVPSRPSVFPLLLRDIAGLKCLTKLCLCHFSIRYLPPEIACLIDLEYLDLSFNKMRNLPVEITRLSSLLSLKVANNKLIEVPPGLCSLQRLESLDFSNNKLTSLENLDLLSMYNMQTLNLQHNKLLRCCSIPSWVCCNLEGNFIDDFTSSSSEMDVVDGYDQEATSENSASMALSANSFQPRKSKRWKRQYHLRQRARQERLNNSRKCVACKPSELIDNSMVEGSSSIVDHAANDKEVFTEEAECKDSLASVVDEYMLVGSLSDAADVVEESSSSVVSNSPPKSKRHLDGVIDNPKQCKTRRPTDHSELSCKYSMMSFCGIDDYLPDGFYDAGRDEPFMSLRSYEQNLHLDSREVILVDRQRDEMLDAIVLRAQALIYHFKQIDGLFKDREHVAVDNMQIASLLALLVSDHFGGSDKSNIVQRARKEVSGHIIHRDIKSENILIDLDKKRADGTTTVKLCDFDMAIPFRSSLHTCSVAHIGSPQLDLFVGTPRWMAPEVGKRPQLPEELEVMAASKAELEDLAKSCSVSNLDKKLSESRILRFLVSLCRLCTEKDPGDRPTVENLYNLLLTCANSFPSQSQENS
ncbi:hypothetical protein K7X08_005972 [Anisodus acutangulus]|uniref:Protein kinase domain-containing protein n=1 Tax=Anisodus acutangulus TaxID=402998 RepID=A0A9Q1LVW5_9SOLA|nr:hypothetical protein K7X08_005972 [Anisodus acutangulus]